MPDSDSWEKSRKFAEQRGLTCYVYAGEMYVMDGGTRASRERDWYGSPEGDSRRQATDEECDLWDALRR